MMPGFIQIAFDAEKKHLVGGFSPPLWKMMEFVSWDDDIPNWMESHNPFMFQTTNQTLNPIKQPFW